MNTHRLLAVALLAAAASAQAARPETIDRMVTGTFGGYTQTYTAGGTFMVFPVADYYVLDDGSSWDSGAGVQYSLNGRVEVVERSDGLLRYTFEAPADGVLYSGTDYSFGDHSAQGVLGVTGDLVLEARRGSRQGTMKGWVEVLSNDATWYDSFNYYSAPVGSRVYFETTFTLSDARFTRGLFQRDFTYNEVGFVDFTQLAPVPEAATLLQLMAGLGLLGLRRATRRQG